MAGHLGCTVRELQERIDAREFMEWAAYYQTDPWGGERGDLQAAIVASTIANVHRDPKKPAFKLDNFLLKFGQVRKRMGPGAIAATLKTWFAAVNKKFGGKEIK